MSRPLAPGWLVGEFAGTFVLVFFGCGSVAAATLTGAAMSAFHVAAVWGAGVAIAIQLTGKLSGAHLNPAVTLALATAGDFPWRRAPGYLGAQWLGAFAASAVLYAIYAGPLHAFESAHGIVRGSAGSEASAMIFGEYFPNPGGRPLPSQAVAVLSHQAAFLIEILGTAVLVVVILGVTHPRNAPQSGILTAFAIGLTITLLISLLGPLTMACFNPARDFAPRVFSSLAGWGSVPFTANGLGWLTVYIVAPILGGQLGAVIHRVFFRPHYAA